MDVKEEFKEFVLQIFSEILHTPLKNLDDFKDGRLFLEALSFCDTNEMSNDLPIERKYEIIEDILDRFYNIKTNVIVDFEYLAFKKGKDDDLINLCILIIVMCRNYENAKAPICLLDLERMFYLLKQFKKPEEYEAFIVTIKNVLSKRFDTSLEDQKGSYSSDITDNQKSKLTFATDNADNSFNIPSITSETSYNIGFEKGSFLHNDSNSSKNSSRHSKQSRRLQSRYKSKNNYNSRSFLNYDRSPKQNENQNQMNQTIKSIMKENKDLLNENNNLENKVAQLEQQLDNEKNNFNNSLNKLKSDNRKLNDEKDELTSKIEEIEINSKKKDNEISKLMHSFTAMKKKNEEKIDEINHLKFTNKELNYQIYDCEEKLKSKDIDNNKLKLSEIDLCKENQLLVTDILKLKEKLDQYDIEFRDVRNKVVRGNQTEDIDSPAFEHAEGESMNVINEFKLVEFQDKMYNEIEKYKEEISNLKHDIDNKQEIIRDVKCDLEICTKKYDSAVSELKYYSSQLTDAKVIDKERVLNIKHHSVEKVMEILSEMFTDTDLSMDDKEILIKHMTNMLNVDMCQKEFSSFIQRQVELHNVIQQKNEEILRLKNAFDDCMQNYHEMKDLLKREKELTRYHQFQSSKSEENQFHSKTIIRKTLDENYTLQQNITDLNERLKEAKSDFKKAKADSYVLKKEYDKCLVVLNKYSQDCKDYEEIMMEDIQKPVICKSVGCQTNTYGIGINMGTNVLSPRTPSMTPNRSNRKYQNTEVILNNPKYLYDEKYTDFKSPDFRNIARESNASPLRQYTNRSSRNVTERYIGNRYNESNDREKSVNSIVDKRLDNLKRNPKKRQDSPLVKPQRIQELCSRNVQQPDHLKSSYYPETQGMDDGQLAEIFLKNMQVPINDFEESQYMNTSRSTKSRCFTNVDPMNLRSDLNNRGEFKYNGSEITDNCIKYPNKTNVLRPSTNFNAYTNKNDSFRKPTVPTLNLRDSDRENAIPVSGKEWDDRSSVTPSSLRFDVMNSPKPKAVGYTRPKMNKR